MNKLNYKYRNSKLLMSLLVILFTMMFSSCQDKLEEAFLNPEKATDVKIEYLYSSTLMNELYLWEYGDYFHKFDYFNAFLQTGGPERDMSFLQQPNSNLGQGWFGRYYVNIMKNVNMMNELYNGMSDEEKAQYDVYMDLANITKCYGIGFISDLFDDVPYSEAFGAFSNNFFPKYDTQQEVYKAAISELKEIATRLNGMTLDPDIPVHALLASQDVFFGGDLDKWSRFASSIRLRMAMRLSEVDPDYAKSEIADIVSNFDLITEPEYNAVWIERDANRKNDNSRIWRSYKEQRTWGAMSFLAPGYMFYELMQPANDPRIPVLFAPDKNGEYTALDQLPSHPHIDPVDYSADIAASYPSQYNWTTFGGNYNLPFLIVTSSEINFILAEAAQRKWITANAKAYYDKALQQSIDLYYDINANSTDVIYNFKPTKPDQTAIDDFINNSTAAYDGTIECIIEQKYIHFNMHKPYEIWNDLRRVGYPNIPNKGLCTETVVRMPYPGSEETTNFDNFKEVNEKNNYTTKVWWDAN